MKMINDFITQFLDLNHWIEIIFLLISYLVSILAGYLYIKKISDTSYKITLKEDYEKWELGQHRWTSQLVGILERIIITTSIIFGVGEVLVLWYAVKITSIFNIWNDEKKKGKYGRSRATFYIYLLGTSLSLIYGGLGAQIFFWLKGGELLYPLLSTLVLLVMSQILVIFISKKEKKN
jgi:hypothetical protein